MSDIDLEKFKKKLEITEAAIGLYLEKDGDFTFNEISDKVEMEVAELFEYFANKSAILEFYYYSIVIRYRLMIEEIDDFNTYMLEEKLSNFIYSSLDMLQENQEFVEATYESVIYYSYGETDFEIEIQTLFKEFFTEDGRIAGSSSILLSSYFYVLLRKKYIHLIHFWLNDDSDDKELTMALTDKYTSFIQELSYSAVIDKGIELLRFMFTHKIPVRNIPFVKDIMNKIEIRD